MRPFSLLSERRSFLLHMALRGTGGSALPSGYKRLIGLTLKNAKYVTDIYLTGDSTLQFSASGRSGNWIGSYNTPDSTDNYSFYATTSSGGKYLRYDGGTYNSSIVNDERYDVTITPTGAIGTRIESDWDSETFECSVPMCIGGTAPDGTPAPNVTFYGSIFASNIEFIPCERESDNALGYYANGTFYEDVAGGTVISLGYDADET